MTKGDMDKVWKWTNEAYKQALLEEYPAFWNKFRNDWLSRASANDLKSEADYGGLEIRSPSINNKYMSKILKFNSDQLSLIIEADKHCATKRHSTTIEAILTELMERSMHGEG